VNRYPYHRYLRYLILEGDDVNEICDHFVDLGYTPPARDEVDELISSIREGRVVDDHLRAEHGVTFFDEEGGPMVGMYLIVESPEVRTMAERLLLDRLPLGSIASILSFRFDERISAESVERFREGFWDTVTLSNLDFHRYFMRTGKRARTTKVGSLKERPLVSQWQEGLPPDEDTLSVDDMLRSITVDSFMNFKKSQEMATPENASMARGWAGTFIAASRAGRASALSRARKKDSGIKTILRYTEGQAPSLEDLHQQNVEANLGTGHIIDEIDAEKEDTDAA
jgi:hypothetical protein